MLMFMFIFPKYILLSSKKFTINIFYHGEIKKIIINNK